MRLAVGLLKAIDYFFHLTGTSAGDPDRHRDREAAVLPARQQILRLDGEDESGAARDGGDPRAVDSLFVAHSGGEPLHTSPDCAPWRRQDETAAGADGALQEGEDQSARR